MQILSWQVMFRFFPVICAHFNKICIWAHKKAISHFRKRTVKDKEYWILAFENSAWRGFSALGSNRKTIPVPKEETSWTKLDYRNNSLSSLTNSKQTFCSSQQPFLLTYYNVRILSFWVVTMSASSDLKMERVSFSETFVSTQESARRHDPEK
jgi:hypothetical protein